MADLVTTIRRALGLEHRPLEAVPPADRGAEHLRIDRRLATHARRLATLEADYVEAERRRTKS